MKATVYIFGKFADGYSQYPDNYTRDLFESVAKSRKGATELVYHRDGALTYYIYTREVSKSSNTFIGLCYVFNGILISDFGYLFDIFEDAITNIVVQGEILEFTNDGALSTKVNQLYTNADELQRVADYLNSKLSSLGRYAEKLPPVNFSVASNEWKNFSFDEIETIQTAIKDNPNIRVIKGNNYDTDTLKGYAHKLKTQNDTIQTLTAEKEKLKNEISALERKKKQFTIVIILTIIIAFGAIIFIAVLNSHNQTIKRKNRQIEQLESHRDHLRQDSIFLTRKVESVNESLRTTRTNLEELRAEYALLDSAKTELDSIFAEQTERYLALIDRNNELENMIDNMGAYSYNGYSSGYSSTTYTVGPSTSSSIGGHDKDYAEWLYASSSLRINSFYVHADKSGYITIGLYNASGGLVATHRAYVSSGQWTQVSPSNFELESGRKYYLALYDANGIALSYHSSNSSEYSKYKRGSLQIIGSCSKNSSNYGSGYYQYFYNINYSLKN